MNPARPPSPRRRMLGDFIIACRLVDEAGHRVTARVFGVPRDQTFLVTMVALGASAEALHGFAGRAFKVTARPSVGDTFIGATVVKETVSGITGLRSRDQRYVGTLIAAAVVAKTLRPTVEASVRGITSEVHNIRAALRRMYEG
jgi:hypothetical protein